MTLQTIVLGLEFLSGRISELDARQEVVLSVP